MILRLLPGVVSGEIRCSIAVEPRLPARELFVLGTASQVPTRHRSHNSFFLRWDREGILFDPGEGTQRQLILAGLAASDITRICITHFHGDHCLGLAGIVQRLSLDNAGPVTVHYPASGQVYFERLREASIYLHRHELVAKPIAASGVIHEDAELFLEAIELSHAVDCYGYRLREKDAWRMRPERLTAVGLRGPAVGELRRDGKVTWNGRTVQRHEVCEVRPGQAFAFVMDTRPCSGAQQLALGADLLVCEATFMEDETELAHISGHMTARQAAVLARDAGVRQLVLGHFSQRYPDAEEVLAEARVEYPSAVAAVEPDVQAPEGTRHRIAVPPRAEIRLHGQFEAHITVDTADTAGFACRCGALGVNCILIERAAQSLHQGDFNVVRAEVEGLAAQLREAGFAVIRRKIEVPYDAQGVPATDAATRELPPSGYFEYQAVVALSQPSRLAELQELSQIHAACVSRTEGSEEARFVTLRVPRAGRSSADVRYAELLAALREGQFAVLSERRKFTVYDSSFDLDRGWLSM